MIFRFLPTPNVNASNSINSCAPLPVAPPCIQVPAPQTPCAVHAGSSESVSFTRGTDRRLKAGSGAVPCPPAPFCFLAALQNAASELWAAEQQSLAQAWEADTVRAGGFPTSVEHQAHLRMLAECDREMAMALARGTTMHGSVSLVNCCGHPHPDSLQIPTVERRAAEHRVRSLEVSLSRENHAVTTPPCMLEMFRIGSICVCVDATARLCYPGAR